jgi:hypothetical protein
MMWDCRVSLKRLTQRGQGRGFAAARWAAHEHQALVVGRDVREVPGEADFLDGGRLLGDDAEDTVHALVVDKDVRTIPTGVLDEIAEIELLVVVELLQLLFGQDLGQDGLGLGFFVGLSLELVENAGGSDQRFEADRQVQIGGAAIARFHQQRVQLWLAFYSPHPKRLAAQSLGVFDLGVIPFGHLFGELERTGADETGRDR